MKYMRLPFALLVEGDFRPTHIGADALDDRVLFFRKGATKATTEVRSLNFNSPTFAVRRVPQDLAERLNNLDTLIAEREAELAEAKSARNILLLEAQGVGSPMIMPQDIRLLYDATWKMGDSQPI